MLDYGALLLDPLYNGPFGASASLLAGTGGAITLTVIDKTAGVERALMGALDISTLEPAAIVRMSELTANGLSRADLKGASITFNSKTWLIVSIEAKPVPSGEAAGELFLFLEET